MNLQQQTKTIQFRGYFSILAMSILPQFQSWQHFKENSFVIRYFLIGTNFEICLWKLQQTRLDLKEIKLVPMRYLEASEIFLKTLRNIFTLLKTTYWIIILNIINILYFIVNYYYCSWVIRFPTTNWLPSLINFNLGSYIVSRINSMISSIPDTLGQMIYWRSWDISVYLDNWYFQLRHIRNFN